MTPSITLTLKQFNQQVLACQDDAFTLAIALVGDEELACQIVEEAIWKVYMNGRKSTQPMHLQVLKEVILYCRRFNHPQNLDVVSIQGWEGLNHHYREVLLLVDVLRRTYQDAAFILDTTEHEINYTVAIARRILARGLPIVTQYTKEIVL